METMEKQSEQQVEAVKSNQLVVDLMGPFVIHFCEDIVRVCAPKCSDHYANILTDSDDTPVIGALSEISGDHPSDYLYTLTGPKSCAGKCSCLLPQNLLIANCTMDPVETRICNWVLEVPKPDTIIPLLPEQVWMHKNGSNVWVNCDNDILDGNRARALRLLYSNCPVPPRIGAGILQLGRGINAKVLGVNPSHYHITLRYSSRNSTPDEHHEDAYRCFQEIRSLVPGAATWRVDFVSPEPSYLLDDSGPVPVDCGAPVLVVQDAARESLSY